MSAIIIIISIFVGLILLAFSKLYLKWCSIQEDTKIYRCDSNMNICGIYRVEIVNNQKFLYDLNYRESPKRYEFFDYLKDLREYRIYTEEEIDSFD